MSREGPLTSWGGILPRSELRVCVTGFRDASPPHADSALVWTDRWGSMKARAFSLAIHGHYLNYQKAPTKYPHCQSRDHPSPGTNRQKIPLTLTLRSGAWATTPPEERLSLSSGPPEVSVVLPTGTDGGGWATEPSPEDSEDWCVTRGRRSEPREHLGLPELTRRGLCFPLTGKNLSYPVSRATALPPCHPVSPPSPHPHQTNLKILQ